MASISISLEWCETILVSAGNIPFMNRSIKDDPSISDAAIPSITPNQKTDF